MLLQPPERPQLQAPESALSPQPPSAERRSPYINRSSAPAPRCSDPGARRRKEVANYLNTVESTGGRTRISKLLPSVNYGHWGPAWEAPGPGAGEGEAPQPGLPLCPPALQPLSSPARPCRPGRYPSTPSPSAVPLFSQIVNLLVLPPGNFQRW